MHLYLCLFVTQTTKERKSSTPDSLLHLWHILPSLFFQVKETITIEQLQLYQVEETERKSASSLKYVVLEIRRSDFLPSLFQMTRIFVGNSITNTSRSAWHI